MSLLRDYKLCDFKSDSARNNAKANPPVSLLITSLTTDGTFFSSHSRTCAGMGLRVISGDDRLVGFISARKFE